jgi:phospholipase/lecithinase/hemolysin
MATQWLRRAWLMAACATALVLAACGGGSTTESQLAPARVIVFGDATADSTSATRYTVNDGTPNSIWTEYVAAQYGLTPISSAKGNVRVVDPGGANGAGATPTVAQQIDIFLTGNSFNANDLVLVSAGTSDIIAEVQAAIQAAPTQTADEAIARADQAARDLGAQVQRLVNAGARHVAVAGPYNLARSPWALQTGQASLLSSAVRAFNNRLLITMETAALGSSVLYVSQETFIDTVISNPGGYALSDTVNPVCADSAKDPGPGIGTGTNQLNSSKCMAVRAGADANTSLFADRVYLTPTGNLQFGAYVYARLRERW